MAVSYPNFAGKHAEQALVTPAGYAAYLRRDGALEDYRPPGGIILCYQAALFDWVLRHEGISPPEGKRAPERMVTLPSTGGRVGLIGRFGIGAPGAVVLLEELAALGTTAFVSVGTAGSLQRSLRVGDLVVCDAAIRDEGVSHHYLPPGRMAIPAADLTAALAAAVAQLGPPGATTRTGTTWTIDTPYRETVAEARHYQAEGVACVEMEAAALFAVGQVRGLRVASAFVISDLLADLVWDPQFGRPQVRAGLRLLYQAAVRALLAAAGLPGGPADAGPEADRSQA